MRHRLAAMLGAAAIVVAACGTGTPSEGPTGSSAGSAAPPASQAPPPSVATTGEELFDTNYAPEEGTDGGSIIIGDWQEANQFNPYYLSQVTEANVASADVGDADRAHARLQVRSGPRGRHPDDVQRRRGRARRRRRRDDRDLDAPRPTSSGRTASRSPATTSSTRGSGSSTRTTSASSPAGSTRSARWSACRTPRWCSTTRRSTRATSRPSWPRFRATTSSRSRSRTRSTAPASGPRKSPNLPVSGAFKFESVTPQQELRLAKNENYTSFETGKPAHLDNLIWKWYGDADLMIAGFKANEIDFATDLQDSDLPKVQDLGEQVSAIASLTYEFLRPNWSEGPFDAGDQDRWLLAQRRPSPTAARAARWPTRPCARPSPSRSTRTRSTAGSWAAPSRSPTPTSPPAPGSSRTRPRRRSTRSRPRRSSRTPAGPTPTATASGRRTA